MKSSRKLRAIISLLCKILCVIYAFGVTNGHFEFMQNQTFFIQILPPMFAMVIVGLCDE